jgi:hypothetical protein
MIDKSAPTTGEPKASTAKSICALSRGRWKAQANETRLARLFPKRRSIDAYLNGMGRPVVKTIAACIVSLGLTIFLVPPALAVDSPTTEVACQEAGMRWLQKTGRCKQVTQNRKLGVAEKIVGLIGLACCIVGLALLLGSREARRG